MTLQVHAAHCAVPSVKAGTFLTVPAFVEVELPRTLTRQIRVRSLKSASQKANIYEVLPDLLLQSSYRSEQLLRHGRDSSSFPPASVLLRRFALGE